MDELLALDSGEFAWPSKDNVKILFFFIIRFKHILNKRTCKSEVIYCPSFSSSRVSTQSCLHGKPQHAKGSTDDCAGKIHASLLIDGCADKHHIHKGWAWCVYMQANTLSLLCFSDNMLSLDLCCRLE